MRKGLHRHQTSDWNRFQNLLFLHRQIPRWKIPLKKGWRLLLPALQVRFQRQSQFLQDIAGIFDKLGAILEKLVASLSKSRVTELLNYSMAYRLGQIRHKDFYVYLRDLCEKNGISFKDFAAMNSYIQYVLLSDRINAEKLFDEVTALEESSYGSLAKTPATRSISATSPMSPSAAMSGNSVHGARKRATRPPS